jgi:hypothetical protein
MELLHLFIQHLKANPHSKSPSSPLFITAKAINSSHKDRHWNFINLLVGVIHSFSGEDFSKISISGANVATVSFTEQTSAEQI